MAVQGTHEVKLLPVAPAALSVAQAKVNLLALGEEAEQDHRSRPAIAGILKSAAIWAPLVATLVGVLAGRVGHRRESSHGGRPARGAGLGISLGLLIKLGRTALPVLLRYLAVRRQMKAVAREHQRRSRAAGVAT